MRRPSLIAIRSFEQRHRWRIAAVVGVYVAWLLFGWFAIPRIVAPRLERAVTEATGHRTTLGAMEFDPLWLAVTLHDLRIATSQGETLISVDRIHVDFETRSLIDRAWNFKALELDGPYVNAVLRADGSLNLGDLAGPQPAPAVAGPVTLPRVVIQNFALRGGNIDFADLGLTPTLRTSFPNLGLSLTDFSTLPNDRGEYALQARGPAGGLFQWRGTVGANPFASDGRFTLEGGGIPPWFDLVADRFAFDVSDGLLRARIDYSLGDSAAGLAFKITDAEVEIDQLALGPRDGAPLLTLPTLAVSGVKVDLNAHKVQVGEVRVEKLGLKLARDAGGIDLIELLTAPPPAAAPAAAPTTSASAATPSTAPVATAPSTTPELAAPAAATPAPRPTLPWRITLDRFALIGADVALTDLTLPTPGTVSVAPLDIAVTDVALGPETRFAVLLDAVINGAGKLHVQGPLTGTDPAGTLTVKLDGLALAPFQPWIEPIARIELLAGALGVDAKLTLTPPAAPTVAAAPPKPASPPSKRKQRVAPAKAPRAAEPALRFSGYAQLAGLRVQDAHLKQDLLRWKNLQLRGFDVALGPQRIRIDEIYAEQPYLRFIIGADGTTNLAGLMVGGGTPADAPAASPADPAAKAAALPPTASSASPPALPLEIKRVTVAGGSANFADQSLDPAFATGIQELAGSIVGLSSLEAQRAEITLDGKVDRYAPVKVRGKVNLFAADAFSDVTMSFHDIELTTFTPYAGKFAGYKIDKGRLSLDIRYQLEDRHIKGDHRIVLDQLTLGEQVESADAMSLPIKLALALLKDSRGVIDLDLPIEGSLDDPEFRYGPIVWKAVISVFTKIVTAPFAALGALFGGGDDLSKLEFAAGAATLDAAGIARLDTLAKGLAERPALRLEVRGVAAPAADGELLARRRVLDALRPDGSADALVALTPKEQKALLALHEQHFGAAPTVAGLAEGAKPTPEQLLEAALTALASADGPAPEALRTLAQARAAAVKDYLVTRGMVPAERVFLLEADTATVAAPGQPVAMTLALNAE